MNICEKIANLDNLSSEDLTKILVVNPEAASHFKLRHFKKVGGHNIVVILSNNRHKLAPVLYPVIVNKVIMSEKDWDLLSTLLPTLACLNPYTDFEIEKFSCLNYECML